LLVSATTTWNTVLTELKEKKEKINSNVPAENNNDHQGDHLCIESSTGITPGVIPSGTSPGTGVATL